MRSYPYFLSKYILNHSGSFLNKHCSSILYSQVENPAVVYISSSESWPENEIHLGVSDSIQLLHVEIASKTAKRHEDKKYHFLRSKVDRNIGNFH